MSERPDSEPVYNISVAAAMVSSHPQTLRLYERSGLLHPRRSRGNARLYTASDIERIRRIQSFTAMGVNLAGVEVAFRLLERIERLEALLAQRQEEIRRELEEELTAELRARLRRGEL